MLVVRELKTEFCGRQIAVLFNALGNEGKLYIDGVVADTSKSVASTTIAALRGRIEHEAQTHIIEVYVKNLVFGFVPRIRICIDGQKVAGF
jgi:hypothetical protein